ncbi:AI-2E family transporter [Marinivivus vitaminiproducens]|uniref:AI-2E family transporter n=1 Tax=Marinivivus vitaminiproducens TaxID=3035935 RepID=UPI00279984A2|nr:AI-2E family transporter [Geminicoccaceae bacterium SCSIO 64248]
MMRSNRPAIGMRERRVEQTIALIALGMLAIGCAVVALPFLPALVWALILTVTTWPGFARLRTVMGGRTNPAALAMSLLLAIGLLMPFAILGLGLADNISYFSGVFRQLRASGPPGPPSWLGDLPLVGGTLVGAWQTILAGGLLDMVSPYIAPVSAWLFQVAAGLGNGLLQLALSVLATFFLYRDGEAAARRLVVFVERLAGERGRHLLDVAQATMNGVVYGIIGTGVAQGAVAGAGLALTSVPAPLFLSFAVAILSIIPGGPAVVMWPAAIWLFYEDRVTAAVFLFLWGTLAVGTVDNVIRPFFISRGADLPLLVVFLGVIGGAFAFGLLGVFLGPTLLAIGFTLLKEWTTARTEQIEHEADEA